MALSTFFNVLVVSAQEQVRHACVYAFEQTHEPAFQAQQACTASKALRLAATNSLACIVFDHQPPAMDCIDYLYKLNNQHFAWTPPVIILINPGEEGAALDAFAHGVHHYAIKTPDTSFAQLLPFIAHQAHAYKMLDFEQHQVQPVQLMNTHNEEVLFDVAYDGVIALTRDGTTLFANSTAANLLATSINGLVQRDITNILNAISPAKGHNIAFSLMQHLNNGTPFRASIPVPDRKSRSGTRYLSLSCQPFQNGEHSHSHALLMVAPAG